MYLRLGALFCESSVGVLRTMPTSSQYHPVWTLVIFCEFLLYSSLVNAQLLLK